MIGIKKLKRSNRRKLYERRLPDFASRKRVMLWIQKPSGKITFYSYWPVSRIPLGCNPIYEDGELTWIIGIDAHVPPYAIDTLPPKAGIISPRKLWRAVWAHIRPIKELSALPMSTMMKAKLGIFAVIIVALLVVTFFMSAPLLGGS